MEIVIYALNIVLMFVIIYIVSRKDEVVEKDDEYLIKGIVSELIENEESQIYKLLDKSDRTVKDFLEKTGEIKSSISGVDQQTRNLISVLNNNQSRGQWAEFQVEDLLEIMEYKEGIHYETQKRMASGTIPDFTFYLPENKTINMDSKFPLTIYMEIAKLNSDLENETLDEIARRDILESIKNKNKEFLDKAIKTKIDETIKYGGDQLLLQGGHHPKLGLSFYTDLFRKLKSLYPQIKLHALGPPEVAHICKIDNISHEYALSELKNAGMDSMPGAGAEILSDRVRRLISKGKCTGREWLEIMKVAHKLNITTSATMMFGHVETLKERFDHLVDIRDVQNDKPKDSKGFLAFIPWPFMDDGTLLQRVKGINNEITSDEYIRMLAISRIMLPNITNIQASWLTVGAGTAQICLHGGANDMGSIMLEENVVSAAGAPHRFTSESIQNCISDAGFKPQLRDQQYNFRTLPKNIEQQLIDY